MEGSNTYKATKQHSICNSVEANYFLRKISSDAAMKTLKVRPVEDQFVICLVVTLFLSYWSIIIC